MLAAYDPKLKLEEADEGYKITGPYITITRDMVEKTCFPQGAKYSKSIDRILYGLALTRKGKLIT